MKHRIGAPAHLLHHIASKFEAVIDHVLLTPLKIKEFKNGTLVAIYYMYILIEANDGFIKKSDNGVHNPSVRLGCGRFFLPAT
ncbi:hypothetical protein ACFQ45_03880 [Rhodanobacter aciditrophus]|uniref:Uncharacterized protein n=1 Tax=Rhodanobacter aciditrophus TaxID=1623218 RepID=A0ABW4AX05_9GAMM